jgi:hypothetical protein
VSQRKAISIRLYLALLWKVTTILREVDSFPSFVGNYMCLCLQLQLKVITISRWIYHFRLISDNICNRIESVLQLHCIRAYQVQVSSWWPPGASPLAAAQIQPQPRGRRQMPTQQLCARPSSASPRTPTSIQRTKGRRPDPDFPAEPEIAPPRLVDPTAGTTGTSTHDHLTNLRQAAPHTAGETSSPETRTLRTPSQKTSERTLDRPDNAGKHTPRPNEAIVRPEAGTFPAFRIRDKQAAPEQSLDRRREFLRGPPNQRTGGDCFETGDPTFPGRTVAFPETYRLREVIVAPGGFYVPVPSLEFVPPHATRLQEQFTGSAQTAPPDHSQRDDQPALARRFPQKPAAIAAATSSPAAPRASAFAARQKRKDILKRRDRPRPPRDTSA